MPSHLPKKASHSYLASHLLNVGVFLLELVAEAEGDDGKARLVHLDLILLVPRYLLAIEPVVDLAQDLEVTGLVECLAEQSRVRQVCQRNAAVAFKAQVDERKVLGDDGSWRARREDQLTSWTRQSGNSRCRSRAVEEEDVSRRKAFGSGNGIASTHKLSEKENSVDPR